MKEVIVRLFGTSYPNSHTISSKFLGLESPTYLLLKTEIKEFTDHNLLLRFARVFLFLAYNRNSSASALKDLDSNETFSNLIKTSALSYIQCNTL